MQGLQGGREVTGELGIVIDMCPHALVVEIGEDGKNPTHKTTCEHYPCNDGVSVFHERSYLQGSVSPLPCGRRVPAWFFRGRVCREYRWWGFLSSRKLPHTCNGNPGRSPGCCPPDPTTPVRVWIVRPSGAGIFHWRAGRRWCSRRGLEGGLGIRFSWQCRPLGGFFVVGIPPLFQAGEQCQFG